MVRLTGKERAVGTNSVLRALSKGELSLVYIARDADPFVTRKVAIAAEKAHIELVEADSMKLLGSACGLSVAAAAAGILKK
ncbi:MAG: ribosomal L7Ae/L30e/S12e/Gadd45 family protein [Oscillospiraceae bacterium]|jgi:large subunit ribosomal protein L7A|nr:ribosomal L7Ae/L30e/S12e/Gadd45 family protein [Oscillospiraceae bacterium]